MYDINGHKLRLTLWTGHFVVTKRLTGCDGAEPTVVQKYVLAIVSALTVATCALAGQSWSQLCTTVVFIVFIVFVVNSSDSVPCCACAVVVVTTAVAHAGARCGYGGCCA